MDWKFVFEKIVKKNYNRSCNNNSSNYAENVSNMMNKNITEKIFTQKTNLAFFGSCVTLDTFRSYYNNYKNDFNKVSFQQRSTIISLMHPKVPYDKKDLAYINPEEDKEAVILGLFNDFDKIMLEKLKDVDYLIVNLVHDVRLGVLEFENSYITNIPEIKNTDFYKKNSQKLREISMNSNEEEFFNLFKKSCDLFFNYLSTYYPDLKVVLQKIKMVDYYVSKEGKPIYKNYYHDVSTTLNPFLKILEEYIENNYEVYVIPFPDNIFADEKHIWGLHNTHYTPNYYTHVYNEMKIISLENKINILKEIFMNNEIK